MEGRKQNFVVESLLVRAMFFCTKTQSFTNVIGPQENLIDAKKECSFLFEEQLV